MKWTTDLPTQSGFYFRFESCAGKDCDTLIHSDKEVVYVFAKGKKFQRVGGRKLHPLITKSKHFNIIVHWKGPLNPDEN